MLGNATRVATLVAALAMGFGTACSSQAPEPETAALPAVEGPPPVTESTADANAAIPATLMEAAGLEEDGMKAEVVQKQANATK